MNTLSSNPTQPCFCGSNVDFSSCCQPFINEEQQVQTAEQLMRSRFSAYAIGNAQYIYDTYAKSSQTSQSVNDIEDWSKSCIWVALTIYPTIDEVTNSTEAFVEFSAFYITQNTLCELREKSRFILEDATTEQLDSALNAPLKQWRYIDGDIIAHNELSTIKRNSLCPCNQYSSSWQIKKGKKFKHCCGK
jgi:SEC-C motif-containing protein